MILNLYRGLDIDMLRQTNPQLRISAKDGKYLMLAKRGTPRPGKGGRNRIIVECCSCDVIAYDGKTSAKKRGWEFSTNGRTATCPDCARFNARQGTT